MSYQDGASELYQANGDLDLAMLGEDQYRKYSVHLQAAGEEGST